MHAASDMTIAIVTNMPRRRLPLIPALRLPTLRLRLWLLTSLVVTGIKHEPEKKEE